MTFFEDLGKTITKVGGVAAEKTKEVAELTKVNAKILDMQNKLDKAYIEVGKKYIKHHPENEEEGMKAAVNAVYVLEKRLKKLQKQLRDLKGTIECKLCGSECDAEDEFCRRCGALLKKEEIIIDAEVAEEDTEAEETVEAEAEDIEKDIE